MLQKTDRRLRAGEGKALADFLVWGPGEGRRRNSGGWDRPGFSPALLAHSPACQGIRIPGLQALRTKGPSPLVSLPVPRDCATRPFDQTQVIMSVDNCFKYQGFRVGPESPWCSQSKGLCLLLLGFLLFPLN